MRLSLRDLFLTAVSLVVFGNVALADDYIKCESYNNRREYCSVNGARDSDIRLSRQLSDASCDEGSTWGRDDRSVWVDKGCRAEFSIRRTYGHGYNTDRYDGDRTDFNYERKRLEDERRRLEEERAQLDRQKAAAAAQPPLRCPPGSHPSTHRCTKAERKKGCKDYAANDGTGRGCSNF